MSLASARAAASSELTEALDVTKRGLSALFADVQRARAALSSVGALAKKEDLRAAVLAAQACLEIAIAVNMAATAAGCCCDVLDSLEEAGKP